jgi:hypothetical protein
MWSGELYRYPQTVDFRLGIPIGPWETVITRKPDSAGTSSFSRDGREWTVPFHEATTLDEADTTQVRMGYDWRKFYGKYRTRLVAVTSDGSEHASFIGHEGKGSETARAVFHRLPVSSIEEFRLQLRRFAWVDFRNVSLRVGRKTTVTVLSWVDPADAPR